MTFQGTLTFLSSNSAAIQAIAAIAMFFVTMVLAILTAIYVWLTYKIVPKKSPRIVVRLTVSKNEPQLMEIEIKNTGNETAYDISFSHEPIPLLSVPNCLDTGIISLEPGDARTIVWDICSMLLEVGTIKISSRYKGESKKSYSSNESEFDVQSHARSSAAYSRLEKPLKEIAKAIKGTKPQRGNGGTLLIEDHNFNVLFWQLHLPDSDTIDASHNNNEFSGIRKGIMDSAKGEIVVERNIDLINNLPDTEVDLHLVDSFDSNREYRIKCLIVGGISFLSGRKTTLKFDGKIIEHELALPIPL